MANARILPKRVDNEGMSRLPIQDGNLIFNTEDKRIYMDDDSNRYQYGGINIVDQNFNSQSLNAISNSTVTKITKEVNITLTTGNWSSTAPYYQTVEIEGMTVNGNPSFELANPTTIDSANDKRRTQSYSYIDYAKTDSNSMTFYCKYKKPTINLPIVVKGVY